MPYGTVIGLNPGGVAYIQDENDDQFAFTFDKIDNYRGEQHYQLKRFGSLWGLRVGCKIFFETDSGNKVLKVLPASEVPRSSPRSP
jgi:hypothetical protein